MAKKKRRKAKARRQSRPKQLTSLSEQATEQLQQQLRQSPLWPKMVAEFGEEKAFLLLQQFRLDID